MRKRSLFILTLFGYCWMTGLGWCEAPANGHYMAKDSVLEGKDDPSIIVPHKSAKFVKHPFSAEVKSISDIRSPLFIQDANEQQPTEKTSSDRVAPPPPPTNLRIVIIRE